MKKLFASVLAVATVASLSVSAFATTSMGELKGVLDSAGKESIGAGDTVVSDTTVFYDLSAFATQYSIKASDLTDKDLFSMSFKKEEGSKIIKAISFVDDDPDCLGGGRKPVIKLELKELMDDSDNKIEVTATLKVKSKGKDAYASLSDDKYEFDLKFYVSNSVLTEDDQTSKAGETGYVMKPVKNEDNTITWENENDTIAVLDYEADSDVNKYYPKLSTKWDDASYADFFADQDAFLFDFVGNPTISSTSRPKLELFNPFINEDDEMTVAPEDVVIYEVVDGELVDVTAKFTVGQNDDGDEVFTIKTRTLGTYIIAEGEASAADEDATDAPADDVVGADKIVPNTGR